MKRESKSKVKAGMRLAAACVACCVVAGGGCYSTTSLESDINSLGVKTSKNVLTDTQVRILGFETPTADWSTNNGGAALGMSNVVSQGSAALSVLPNGWTEIDSVPLSSLGVSRNTATLDVRLPETVYWGEIRLIFIAPSKGVWWMEAGSSPLYNLSANNYHTLSFALNADAQNLISGVYSDLKIKVVVNAPRLSSPYLIDNLVLTEDSSVDSDTGSEEEGEKGSFSFILPSGARVEEAVLVASESIRIADGVSASSQPSYVYCDGSGITEIGADALVQADVISMGNQFLRERAHITGKVLTQGTVTQQNGVVVDGGITENGSFVRSYRYSWDVSIPEMGPGISLEPDQTMELEPGAYDFLGLKSRATIKLSPGTYYFNRFQTEPQGRLEINGNGKAVVIYVFEALTNRSQLIHSKTSADFFIGYLGESTAELDGPFAGTVVAPNAEIRLAPLNGGNHEGQFIGKSINAEARTPINFVPYDHWDFAVDLCPGNRYKVEPGLCGCGYSEDDDDGDGTPNCLDQCRFDPNKTEPGITGCGNSDDDDADSDGIADEVDPRPTDPSQDYSESCEGVPNGTKCDDGVCVGVNTCNNGKCGNAADCMPDCGGTCEIRRMKLDRHYYRTYMHCDCQATWEEAKNYCSAEKYREVLSVDTPQEQSFVRRFLNSVGKEDAWMGANSLSQEGKWKWTLGEQNDGRLFWVGGPDGRRHFAGVVKWADGEPVEDAEKRCGALKADGTWTTENCGELKGFICESIAPERRPGGVEIGDNGLPIGHIGLPATEFEDIDTDCVEPPSGTPEELEEQWNQDQAKIAECLEYDNETDYYSHDCHLTSVGAPPPLDSPGCDPFFDDDSLLDIDPKEPYKIGSAQDCLLTSPTYYDGKIKLCEKHGDCRSGERCGKVGFCCSDNTGNCRNTREGEFWPNCLLSANPDAVCLKPLLPEMNCMPSQVCGVALGEQAKCFEAEADNNPCGQVLYCGVEDELEMVSEASEVAIEPIQAAEDNVFPNQIDDDLEENDTDLEIPDVDADPCPNNKDTDGNCTAGLEHQYCIYKTPDPPAAVVVDDQGRESNARSGSEGGGKTSGFNFDPNFDWIYDIKSGPLGIPKPNLGVSAGVEATATIANLFGSGKEKENKLIDIALSVRLGLDPENNLCGLTTKNTDGSPSVLKILGIDFLPDSFSETLNYPDDELQEQCINKYREFEKVVNQAKKAMRDAEELLKQYKKLKDEGLDNFGNLCKSIAEFVPADFPVSNISCELEAPEDTINRFIAYYSEVLMTRLKNKALELAAGLNGKAPILEFGDTVDLLKLGDEKEITIFNQTFMVGPIPANLEVFLSLAYGFKVSAYYEFTPATVLLQFLDLGINNDSSTIARVGIVAAPYLAARVGLFVGVGFDFGIAAIKAGIEGIVSLAEISVPATAGVGIGFDAVEDKRALPLETLALFGDNSPVSFNVYPKKLHLKFIYDFGVSLAFSDILSGKVSLKLKLKFLFFSKTWKKQIAKWTGFCPPKGKGTRDTWCDISLFKYRGAIVADGLNIPWVSIKLDTPFVQLPYLQEKRDTGQAEVDMGKVENFHYEYQCEIYEPPIE